VTYEQFVSKLKQGKIKHTLLRSYASTFVEVDRFAFAFNRMGRCTGGWIRDCSVDEREEWRKWTAMLNLPTS
jgi:hypothetical protein